jgi:hypothetical protein
MPSPAFHWHWVCWLVVDDKNKRRCVMGIDVNNILPNYVATREEKLKKLTDQLSCE